MKIRKGFVSNSSSTAFIITNLTDKEKTLIDFVTETPWIIKEYIKNYQIDNDEQISQGDLVESAKENNIIFAPHEEKVCYFGDEQGTLVGRIYDYALRGKDISEASKLLDAANAEEDPERVKQLGMQWMAAMEDPKKQDKFTGVDSPSFKVRFHEWCR